MAKKRLSFFEYILLFIGYAAMFFFGAPDSDVIFFTHDYENSIGSFLNHALNYGNGRFLGNFLGFTLANYVFYDFIFIAATLTLFVVFLNQFFFNGDCRTVFPVALLLTVPSSRAFSEVYPGIPTFINYVVPMMLVFAALCLLKNAKASKAKPLAAILILIIGAASCMFAENNTISIFTLSVLAAIYSFIKSKKVDILNISFVIGTVAGSTVMFLLPKITGTSDNLGFYRGMSSMLSTSFACFSTAADIISGYIFPIIIISVCLIYLISKQAKDGLVKKLVIFCLAFFPIEAVLYTIFSKSTPSSVFLYIMQAGLLTVFAIAIFVGILLLEKGNFKTLMLGLFILMLSSVGPMLFVDLYGYRTFYHSFIILLAIALTLIIKLRDELPEGFTLKLPKEKAVKTAVCASAAAFICLCAFVFIQSVYNFNFHVVRTEYIAEKITAGETDIRVPVLPCRGISAEDENPTLVASLAYGVDKSVKITATESINCENADEYYSIVSTDPVSNTINALQHLNFKNGRIVDELVKNK